MARNIIKIISVDNQSTADRVGSVEECSSCPGSTNCCYRAKNIVVLPHEREKIIAANGDESAFRWLPRQKFYVIEKQDGMPCPFLTQYNRCGIYELRPLDCRTWPLTYSPKDGTYFADTECPAVKLGVTAKFLDYVVRLIRVNRPYLSENFHAISSKSLTLRRLLRSGSTK